VCKRMFDLPRQTCRVLLLGSLVVVPGLAGADFVEKADTLTAAQLVEWVLERNPSHAELQEAVREAQSRIKPAGSLDDPQLRYSLAPQTFAGDTPDRFRQTVGFSQKIPWPGTLALRVQQAQGRADMAHYHLEDHGLEVIMAIKAAFAEYYYLHHALEINRQNQAIVSELKRVAEARYSSGRNSQQDVLQAEIRKALLEDQALGLERGRLSLQAQINALIDRAPHHPLPPPAAVDQLTEPPDSESLQSRALEQHPQLLQLRANVRVNRTAIDLADKRFYPDIHLTAGYNNMWENTDMRFELGAAINLPLDRERRRADRNAAEAGAMRARWALADQRNRLLARLEQARVEIIETVRLIELYEQRLLPLADENLAVATAEYQAGTGLFINVTDAEEKKLETSLRLLRGRADYIRAYAALERWTGRTASYHPHQENLP